MAKSKPVFLAQPNGEVMVKYCGITFILKEGDRGFYGAGKAIQLYKQNADLTRTHLVEVGWTQTDNSHSPTGLINHFTNMSECKVAAIKYIDNLLA